MNSSNNMVKKRSSSSALHAAQNQSSASTSSYTIDEALNSVGIGYFQYRLLFLTGMINAADAMEMMLLSFLLPKLQKEWNLSSPWDGSIGAIVFLGQLIGTSVGSVLADKYGRKRIVIAATIGCAIFGTLSAFAYNLSVMLIARFAVGLTVGGSSVSYTLFAEYCPTNHRGSLLIMEQSFWAMGALFSCFLAWLCFAGINDNDGNDWRYYLFFTALPLWIISLFYKIVPESPRFYLTCNDIANAQIMLQNMAKINGKRLPKGNLIGIGQSNNSNNNDNDNSSQRGSIKDIFCLNQYRHTSVLLFVSFWCCVFSYYGISFISERYFEEKAGVDNVYMEMCITTSAEIPSLFLGLLLLDRLGRQQTMSLNFFIFAFCCIGLSIYDDDNIGNYGLFIVFIARMCISLSFMTLYIYFSEFYETRLRATALGFASACGRFAGIATSFISQDLSIQFGMMMYGIAGCVAGICVHNLRQDTLGNEMTITNTTKRNSNVNNANVKYEKLQNVSDNEDDIMMDEQNKDLQLL